MNELSPDPETGGASRRRAQRREFEADCIVEVTTPAWAMLKEPLRGRSANLTQFGIKIVLPHTPIDRAMTWKEGVDGFERLMVRVSLLGDPEPLTLNGQIVWITNEESEDTGVVITALGVLFSVLRDSEARALKMLLSSLETLDE